MSVEQIEHIIEQLPPEDFSKLAQWMDRRRADEWDEQIAADAAAGRLDRFVDEALSDLREGRTTRLP